jgi:hypothetical protein
MLATGAGLRGGVAKSITLAGMVHKLWLRLEEMAVACDWGRGDFAVCIHLAAGLPLLMALLMGATLLTLLTQEYLLGGVADGSTSRAGHDGCDAAERTLPRPERERTLPRPEPFRGKRAAAAAAEELEPEPAVPPPPPQQQQQQAQGLGMMSKAEAKAALKAAHPELDSCSSSTEEEELSEEEARYWGKVDTVLREYELSRFALVAAKRWVKAMGQDAADAEERADGGGGGGGGGGDLERVRVWFFHKLEGRRRSPPPNARWQGGCPEIVPRLRALPWWGAQELPWLADLAAAVRDGQGSSSRAAAAGVWHGERGGPSAPPPLRDYPTPPPLTAPPHPPVPARPLARSSSVHALSPALVSSRRRR